MKNTDRNLPNLIKLFVLVPGFLFIICLLSINIFDRFVLNGTLGLMWVEEVTVIVMVWLIFLSTAAIDRQEGHIKISIIAIPKRMNRILEDAVMIAFFGFLLWSTYELLPKVFSKYAATGWSIKIGYYAIIFGSSVTIFCRLIKYLPERFSKWF